MNNLDMMWDDYYNLLDENEENKNCSHEVCSHKNVFLDIVTHDRICCDCAEVLDRQIESVEWNNYKDETGGFKQSNQRADLWTSDNPYDIGGTIPGFSRSNKLAWRLHYQQTFNHKQKTFWNISQKLEDYCTLIKIPHLIIPTAKDMWHIYMESGKLTRASVRNGVIGSCLYYAAVFCKVPVDRKIIIDKIDGDSKGFLKGEKIFMEIMCDTKYKSLTTNIINVKTNDSFIKYINLLELPFNVSGKCNSIYSEKIELLDCVTPQSSIAGIIYYVVKDILELRKPSKNSISKTLGVCIPTINKVYKILK